MGRSASGVAMRACCVVMRGCVGGGRGPPWWACLVSDLRRARWPAAVGGYHWDHTLVTHFDTYAYKHTTYILTGQVGSNDLHPEFHLTLGAKTPTTIIHSASEVKVEGGGGERWGGWGGCLWHFSFIDQPTTVLLQKGAWNDSNVFLCGLRLTSRSCDNR